MSRTFRELSDEFNATVQNYLRSDVTVDLLLTKYSILLRHKAEEPADRQALADALYTCGAKWLSHIAEPSSGSLYMMPTQEMTLFSRITAEDSLPFVPARAPAELTDIALELLRRAEGPKGGDSESRGYLVRLANQTLGFADTIRAAHEKMASEVATSQDIAPGKKIALKPKDDKLSL